MGVAAKLGGVEAAAPGTLGALAPAAALAYPFYKQNRDAKRQAHKANEIQKRAMAEAAAARQQAQAGKAAAPRAAETGALAEAARRRGVQATYLASRAAAPGGNNLGA